jgi:transcriptional regulator with XRE-family HTH domain
MTEASIGYVKALGARLRKIRLQKGMSLHDVQMASSGRWKAAVIGAYERGDRKMSVARLFELADFYGLPVVELLPEDSRRPTPQPEARRRIVLNLEQLDRVPEPERDALVRFATAIQVQRGDFNGKILTIREDDLLALALVYQSNATDLLKKLEEWGLVTRD